MSYYGEEPYKIIENNIAYEVIVFKQSGTFISKSKIIEFLVVAAGGGGGCWVGGGGGAGGVIATGKNGIEELVIEKPFYDITVGQGGIGARAYTSSNFNRAATNGGDSSIESFVVAKGGGRGASYNLQSSSIGGSGGGGCPIGLPSQGTINQGFSGGGGTQGPDWSSGGGGGADQNGTPGANINGGKGGNGGDGYLSNITGDFQYYGGGGGGAVNTPLSGSSLPGIGGKGGGGDGTSAQAGGSIGKSGQSNTGGGGGGSGQGSANPSSTGGNGGSGIVIIRYKINPIIIKANNKIYSYNNNILRKGFVKSKAQSFISNQAINGENNLFMDPLSSNIFSSKIVSKGKIKKLNLQ